MDGAAFWVEGEDAVGNETHAEAERDEVGDEVEAVGLHGGLDGEAVSGEPGAEEFAGDGFFADEEPALPGEEISQFCGGDFSTRGGKAEVGRGDGDEFVGEAMADLNGAREMRRSGDDAEVEFPAFDSAEDERAGFLAEAELDAGELLLELAKETGEVSEADGAGDADPEDFWCEVESFAESADGFGDAGEDRTGAGVEGSAGGSEADVAGGAVEEGNTEALLHAANLAGDGALGEAGGLAGAGEALVFSNEMEKLEFVNVERPCGEKLIHPGN